MGEERRVVRVKREDFGEGEGVVVGSLGRRGEKGMEVLERDFTVRGRLHWLGVMKDWGWESEYLNHIMSVWMGKANVLQFCWDERRLLGLLLPVFTPLRFASPRFLRLQHFATQLRKLYGDINYALWHIYKRLQVSI